MRKKSNVCRICGAIHCKSISCEWLNRKIRCVKHLSTYFGFDLSLLGSSEVWAEIKRIKKLINDEYHVEKLSMNEIAARHNIECPWPHKRVTELFILLGISRRTKSEAQKTLIAEGKRDLTLLRCKKYLSGWHTSWNHKRVFYRSSYELAFIKALDFYRIDYEMEKLRIPYFDTIQNTNRIAVPDIYIHSKNLIIEIKSKWTLDEIEMCDKAKEYIDRGYVFKLFLTKKTKRSLQREIDRFIREEIIAN